MFFLREEAMQRLSINAFDKGCMAFKIPEVTSFISPRNKKEFSEKRRWQGFFSANFLAFARNLIVGARSQTRGKQLDPVGQKAKKKVGARRRWGVTRQRDVV